MSHHDPEFEAEDQGPGKMPAEFGLPMATFIIIASMVGVGILTTSGFTVFFVGSNTLMLGLWILGGIIAAAGALSLCELSAAMPRTGGDYVYLHEAYGPLAAFLSGWVSFVIGFAAPSAASAFGAAKFLVAPLQLEGPTALYAQRGLATLAILGFATIHATSRSRTAKVQAWITTLKLVLLALFVVAGLAVGWPKHANLVDLPPLTGSRVLAMMFSLVYISYAYIGWNCASYLAGEIVDPQRQLPRAILLGTGGVVVLYLGLNVVYALALSATDIRAIVNGPTNQLPFKPDAVAPIAQIAAQRLFGAGWANPLSVAIGLMLLSSLSAYTLTGPRVIYAMAQAGQFPAVVGRLSTQAATPLVATILQVLVTLALLWTGSFDSLVVYASVGLALFSTLTISSVYVLRVKRPELPRPFKTPGYPITPAIYLVFTLILTAAAFSERFWVSTYAMLSILAGVPIYYVWQWLRLGKRTPRSSEPVEPRRDEPEQQVV